MQSDFFPYFSLSQCLAQLYLWPYGLKDVHSLCGILECLLQNFSEFHFPYLESRGGNTCLIKFCEVQRDNKCTGPGKKCAGPGRDDYPCENHEVFSPITG